MLRVGPSAFGQLTLLAGVALAVGRIRTEAISKTDESLHLHRAGTEDVQVHVDVGPVEHPVLLPVGSAKPQAIADRLQRRQVRGLVTGVANHEGDVDDRLGLKPGHRGRTYVLDQQRAVAERPAYARSLAVTARGPPRLRLDEGHRPVEPLQRSNGDRGKLVLGRHAWLGALHCPTVLAATPAVKPSRTASRAGVGVQPRFPRR